MEKINFAEMTFEDKKKWMLYISLGLAGLILIFYFFSFSYIWNSDYGSEVSVSGWSYIFACIGGKFSSPDKVFGDIAVPFNKWAKYFTRVLGIFGLISFITLIVYVVLNILNARKFSKKLEKAITIVLYVLVGAFLGCIIAGLTMNASRIIPRYCGGNKKCSIQTLAFFPFFFTLAVAILHTIFMHKNKEEIENESTSNVSYN